MGASQQEQNQSQILGTVGNITTGLDQVLGRGPQVFNQSLYAGQGGATLGGIQGLLSGSQNPAFASGASGALGLTSDVAAGNRFGQAAPGFATLRQGVIDDTQTAINRSFLSSGTFGSDKQQTALGKGIGGAIAGLDYQNYQNDIARQERAQAALPGLLNTTLLPSQIQLGAGQLQDADSQAQLLAQQDLFRRKADAQLGLLGDVGGVLSGVTASNEATTEPVPWWQSMLGYVAGNVGNAIGAYTGLR